MFRKIMRVIILFSFLIILSTGCAQNKRSLMEYDYPYAPQESYTPNPYPYYYYPLYIPNQNQPHIFYPPYFYYPSYPFMYP